jgi:hypothetical protein
MELDKKIEHILCAGGFVGSHGLLRKELAAKALTGFRCQSAVALQTCNVTSFSSFIYGISSWDLFPAFS